jgi:hypothetical protein
MFLHVMKDVQNIVAGMVAVCAFSGMAMVHGWMAPKHGAKYRIRYPSAENLPRAGGRSTSRTVQSAMEKVLRGLWRQRQA